MNDWLKYLLVVGIVAIVGYLVWHRGYSREAKIGVAFDSCMKQFGATAEKAKSGAADRAFNDKALNDKAPGANDPAAALANGLGDALASIAQGFGGAVCSTVKETCTQDFDGQVCQAAINRFK